MITIYGKPQCGFCTKAKHFAEQRNFTYEYKAVSLSQVTMTELKERAPAPVRSVPQIFIGNQYIGGYTQFLAYVEETGYNGTGESL